VRRTGLARGQGVKVAISSAPKARKVFVSHPRAGRRAVLAIQTAHLPCAKSPFWWVTFREQTWVTSRERRSPPRLNSPQIALDQSPRRRGDRRLSFCTPNFTHFFDVRY